MLTITREQRQAVEQAGGEPVRLEDPENHRAYILLGEETYQQLQPPGDRRRAPSPEIPEGIRRSQDAFFRDLPELLKDESLRGQVIAYHGDERIGIAPRAEPLIRECSRRGLDDDQFDVFIIEPQSREPEKVEIVTPDDPLEERGYPRRKTSFEVQEVSLFEIPDLIRRSHKAFLRDLPELLKDQALRGKWVAYHGDERIGVGPSDELLIRECLRRGLGDDQYDLFVIEETEEVTFPSSWL